MKLCKTAIADSMPCIKCCIDCEKINECDDACQHAGKGSMADCSLAISQEGMTDLQKIQTSCPDVLKSITDITLKLAELEEQQRVFKTALLYAMEEYGIKKFENESVSFTYVAPTTRTSIDSAKLKKLHPEIAEECSKVSNVSASVRITVK